jgi:hypothetical protein
MATTNRAITTVHTLTMADSTTVKTTWHDTKAEAQARLDGECTAEHRAVHTGGVLGNFRAVSWHK